MSESVRSKQIVLAATVDVVAIIVFVVIGRRNHDEGTALRGVARVAAPFLIGLAAGWIVARAWKAPISTTTAVVIWPVTVVVGMLLRRAVFHNGTALAFIIVATVFTGLLLVGWRALYGLRK